MEGLPLFGHWDPAVTRDSLLVPAPWAWSWVCSPASLPSITNTSEAPGAASWGGPGGAGAGRASGGSCFSTLVSRYLIIHRGGKGISVSAVCFMRSPQCPAAVSKQHLLPSQQSWQAGLGACRGGCPTEVMVPGMAGDPAFRPLPGLLFLTRLLLLPEAVGWEGRVATWASAFLLLGKGRGQCVSRRIAMISTLV